MRYRERVRPPAGWWALAGLASLALLLAFGLYLGPAWGIGAALAVLLVAAVLLGSVAYVIEVDAE